MRTLFGLLLTICGATLASPAPVSVLQNLPIRFEAGRGSVRYSAHTGKFELSILDDGNLWNGQSSRLRTTFLGANVAAHPQATEPLEAKTNYFHGAAPSEWHTGIANFARVRYSGMYPGIDAVFYGNAGNLEYDFVVAPGADPGKIRLQVEGANVVHLDPNGDLILATADGEIRWKKPVVYQKRGVALTTVAASFHLRGDTVTFDLGAYDHARELIIDPVLTYSGNVGGSGNDNAFRCAADSAGNLYVTGKTTSNDLPVSRTAVQPAYGGSTTNYLTGDAFIAKFGPTGTLIYMTYLGGSADDYGTGIAIDSSGNAYVTGMTNSGNFPVTDGVLQRRFGGGAPSALSPFGDAFVVKLNPTGAALLYSTYLGGSRDDEGMAIAVDSAGNAYVVGSTQSSNFPGTATGAQSRYGGEGGQPNLVQDGNLPTFVTGDGFLAKLNPTASQVVFATYIGGPSDDSAEALALDGSGNIIIGGHSLSSFGFTTTAGALQRGYKGADGDNFRYNFGDAFVAKYSASGSLVFSTYLGGSGDDAISALAVDAGGNIYGTGATSSRDFPLTSDAQTKTYQGPSGLTNFQLYKAGDAFVFKMKPDGTALIYSSYLGAEADDWGTAIALDASGNIFVAGFTASSSFPVTTDALQPKSGGVGGRLFNFQTIGDAFLVELNPAGKILYGTYLGGSLDDTTTGLALDADGNVYLVGATASGNFPNAGGLAARSLGIKPDVMPYGDAFIAKISFAAVVVPPPPPSIVITAVQNAASYAEALAPGMFVIVKGAGLGPKDLTLGQLNATTGRQDTIAGGTRILFDNVAAPIVYAWGPQSAAIVPYAVAGKTTVQVIVEVNGQRSAAFAARVQDAQPGLFSADLSGTGQAAAFNQDRTYNSASIPASRGTIIIVYGSGDGVQNVPLGDGQVVTGATTKSALPSSVTIGGVPATILYAGAVPQQVAGVFQVNAQIPDTIAAGNQPVIVTFGSAKSQANLTIAVK